MESILIDNDVNIKLKPKYNEFIKIVDEYTNNTKINNADSEKSNIYKSINNTNNFFNKQNYNIKSIDDLNVIIIKNANIKSVYQDNSTDKEYDITITKKILSNKNSENKGQINKLDKESQIYSNKMLHLLNNIILDDDIKNKFEKCIIDNKSFNEIIDEEINNSDKSIYIKKNNIITKPKSKHIINKKNISEKDQLNKLEYLYKKNIEKKIVSNNSLIVNNQDNLKKICKKFEECFLNSTNGYNLKENLYYIIMSKLKKNIKLFDSGDYICSVIYKKYDDLNNIFIKNNIDEWFEVTKNNEVKISQNDKYLKTCIRLIEKTNKFRKIIGKFKIRAFKSTYLIYGSNNPIEIIGLVKEKIIE